MDTQNTLKDMQYIKDKKETEVSLKDKQFNVEYSDVLNKITRISSALYMVTDHIKDTEPLKDTIRLCAVALIKDIPSASIGHVYTESFRGTITKTRALLEMATILGMISSENTAVLIDAIEHAQTMVEGLVKTAKKEVSATLMGELFNEEEMMQFPRHIVSDTHASLHRLQKTRQSGSSSKTVAQRIPQGMFKGTPSELMERLSQATMSDRNNDKGHVNSKGQNSKRHQKIAEIVLKNERRSTIIEIIKDNKEVGIKDISDAIKNVSGKTIQRELTTLVSEGILKKIGNKRWSRYALKT